MTKRIGILTGGGDCPGLNAVIRAVVKGAVLKRGWEVIGIEDGFDGLLAPEKFRVLSLADVQGILPRGGTILGTTNRGNPFQLRVPKAGPNGTDLVRDVSDELLRTAFQLEIDAVINIGGN